MRIQPSIRIGSPRPELGWAAIVLAAGLALAVVVAGPARLPADAGDPTDAGSANAHNGMDVGASPLQGFGRGHADPDGAIGAGGRGVDGRDGPGSAGGSDR